MKASIMTITALQYTALKKTGVLLRIPVEFSLLHGKLAKTRTATIVIVMGTITGSSDFRTRN